MIIDQHNLSWVIQYPHEEIAGGSMWAVRLPPVIPPAGAAGGPPPASEARIFLNGPADMRPMFVRLTRHPELFTQYCAEMEAGMKEQMNAYRKQHGW